MGDRYPQYFSVKDRINQFNQLSARATIAGATNPSKITTSSNLYTPPLKLERNDKVISEYQFKAISSPNISLSYNFPAVSENLQEEIQNPISSSNVSIRKKRTISERDRMTKHQPNQQSFNRSTWVIQPPRNSYAENKMVVQDESPSYFEIAEQDSCEVDRKILYETPSGIYNIDVLEMMEEYHEDGNYEDEEEIPEENNSSQNILYETPSEIYDCDPMVEYFRNKYGEDNHRFSPVIEDIRDDDMTESMCHIIATLESDEGNLDIICQEYSNVTAKLQKIHGLFKDIKDIKKSVVKFCDYLRKYGEEEEIFPEVVIEFREILFSKYPKFYSDQMVAKNLMKEEYWIKKVKEEQENLNLDSNFVDALKDILILNNLYYYKAFLDDILKEANNTETVNRALEIILKTITTCKTLSTIASVESYDVNIKETGYFRKSVPCSIEFRKEFEGNLLIFDKALLFTTNSEAGQRFRLHDAIPINEITKDKDERTLTIHQTKRDFVSKVTIKHKPDNLRELHKEIDSLIPKTDGIAQRILELKDTNLQYIKNLEMIVNHSDILKRLQREYHLFINIYKFYDENKNFYHHLAKCPDNDYELVAKCFMDYKDKLFSLYPVYLVDLCFSQHILRQKRFEKDIMRMKKLLEINTNFVTLLQMPFTRLVSYKLLLESIGKELLKKKLSTTNITLALDMVKNVLKEGETLSSIDCIAGFPNYLKPTGTLMLRESCIVINRHRQEYEAQVFLFKNIIVFAESLSGQNCKYADSIPLNHLKIVSTEPPYLVLSRKKPEGTEITFILKDMKTEALREWSINRLSDTASNRKTYVEK